MSEYESIPKAAEIATIAIGACVKDVVERIKKAAAEGNTGIMFQGVICTPICKALKRNGYEVSTDLGTTVRVAFTKITWLEL